MTTVLVYGTFDLFHPGHESFLRQAKALGTRLVVCVARDECVENIKKKVTIQKELERAEAVRKIGDVDEVILADNPIGDFRSVMSIQPDIIALGYDQDALREALRIWLERKGLSIQLVTLQSHQPEKFKSSVLRRM